jgi:hypothetical protein
MVKCGKRVQHGGVQISIRYTGAQRTFENDGKMAAKQFFLPPRSNMLNRNPKAKKTFLKLFLLAGNKFKKPGVYACVLNCMRDLGKRELRWGEWTESTASPPFRQNGRQIGKPKPA